MAKRYKGLSENERLIPMRNQDSEIGFLGATAGLPSSALYHLFERALVSSDCHLSLIILTIPLTVLVAIFLRKMVDKGNLWWHIDIGIYASMHTSRC